MIDVTVRKATVNDLDCLVDLFAQASQFLKEQGVDQWQTDGPTRELLQRDILDQHSYLLEKKGVPIGSAYIAVGNEPLYEKISEGQWLNEEPYLVIHRLAIFPKEIHKGYSFFLFQAAEQLAKQEGISNIRIDTHEDNQIMKDALKKYGYTNCGSLHIEGVTPRQFYQKIVTPTT